MTASAPTTVPAASATTNHSDGVDGEEHEDAAVRGLLRHVEGHDQRAGNGAADHHRRDDPQRVGGRERDGTFGDERRAEKPSGPAVLPLRLGEQAGARRVDASAIASGGTMPAAITAAMIRSDAGSATLRPATAKA